MATRRHSPPIPLRANCPCRATGSGPKASPSRPRGSNTRVHGKQNPAQHRRSQGRWARAGEHSRWPRRCGGPLCGRHHPRAGAADRSRRSRRSDRAPIRPASGRTGNAARRGGRPPRGSPALAGAGRGAPLCRPRALEAHPRLPRVLPLLLSARGRGPGWAATAHRGRAGCRHRLRRRDAQNLGGDPHRRRSLHAVAAPHGRGDAAPRRHPPCQSAALAHARARRRSKPGQRRAGGGLGGTRQSGDSGAACQSCARADRGGAGRLRCSDRCRHSDAEPERAAQRRQ